jgi:hypothetical protein
MTITIITIIFKSISCTLSFALLKVQARDHDDDDDDDDDDLGSDDETRVLWLWRGKDLRKQGFPRVRRTKRLVRRTHPVATSIGTTEQRETHPIRLVPSPTAPPPHIPSHDDPRSPAMALGTTDAL